MSHGVERERGEEALRAVSASVDMARSDSALIDAAMEWLMSGTEDVSAAANGASKTTAASDVLAAPDVLAVASAAADGDEKRGGKSDDDQSDGSGDGSDGSESHGGSDGNGGSEHETARELMERELGSALRGGADEKDYLGLRLHDELAEVQKYIAIADAPLQLSRR